MDFYSNFDEKLNSMREIVSNGFDSNSIANLKNKITILQFLLNEFEYKKLIEDKNRMYNEFVSSLKENITFILSNNKIKNFDLTEERMLYMYRFYSDSDKKLIETILSKLETIVFDNIEICEKSISLEIRYDGISIIVEVKRHSSEFIVERLFIMDLFMSKEVILFYDLNELPTNLKIVVAHLLNFCNTKVYN